VSWVLTSKMPYRDKLGAIIGTFGISKDITSLKKAESELESAHRQLIDASRRAGMAEVATGVLHNVGNVLNSVNVSTTVITDSVRQSKVSSVQKLAQWLHKETSNSGPAADAKGEQLRSYVTKLAEHLETEQRTLLGELNLLCSHVEHMKEIVAMQQTYAKVSGVNEPLTPSSLVEDAIRMNSAALSRHDVHVTREFHEAPRVMVDRHKVLQILINLISNAKYALDAGCPEKKNLIIRIREANNRVAISLIDNGNGIATENLTRIFQHGFTTRKTGHGFGLHSSALAARELGGSLHGYSDGVGCGATFVLELPIETIPPANPNP
ncbi:MAG TPA: ATP-binding protein, partial [Candidatus Acidoferrum sp.]|nr:ATP-binding protein [Candidatus Acidoferrum sp.]